MSEIKLKLTIEGKEALAVLDLTDKELHKLIASANKTNESLKDQGRVLNDKLTNVRNALQGIREAYIAVQNVMSQPMMKAAELEVLRENFKGAAEDLELFKQATANTVTEGNLIKLSNQATDLGLSLQQQAILFSLAEDAGDKYGGSTEENFQKIVAASEGSIKGLKSLGIQKEAYEEIVKKLAKATGTTIDKLDAEAQKQIRLRAIIEASGITMDDLNSKVMDAADRFARFDTILEEIQTTAGTVLNKYLTPFIEHLLHLYNSLNDVSPELTEIISLAGTLGIVLGGMQATGILPLIFNINAFKVALQTAKVQMALARMEGVALQGALVGLKTVFMSNPVGFAIMGVMLLAEGISLLSNNTKEATSAELENIKQLRAQKIEYGSLSDIVLDTNKKTSERNSALKQIQEKYPEYLKNISIEKSSYNELTKAIKAGNDEIDRKITLKIADARASVYVNEIASIENDNSELRKEIDKERKNNPEFFEEADTGQIKYKIGFGPIEALVQQYNSNLSKSDELEEQVKKLYSNINKTGGNKIVTDENKKDKDEFEKLFGIKYEKFVSDASESTSKFNNAVKLLEGKLKDREKVKNVIEDIAKKAAIDETGLTGESKDAKKEVFTTATNKLREYESGLIAKLEYDIKIQEQIAAMADTEADIIIEYAKLEELKKKKEALELKIFDKTVFEKLSFTEQLKVDIERLQEKQKYAKSKEEELNILKQITSKEKQIEKYNQDLDDKANPDKKAKETKKLADEFKINSFSGTDKEKEENKQWRDEQLELYKDNDKAKEAIHKEFARRELAIDKAAALAKLDIYAQALNALGSLFGKHTAAYKVLAIAEATISTYKGAAAQLDLPFPMNIIAMGTTIASGLAQVANIVKVEAGGTKGFALGGRLPKGQPGYIEGYHNEIVAPEQNFHDIMTRELIPQAINEFSFQNKMQYQNNNSEELKGIKSLLNDVLSRPATALISRQNLHAEMRLAFANMGKYSA